MRSLLVAVVGAALLLPPPAFAHLEVTPDLLESGREVDLLVELPELRPGAPPTSLAVSGDGIRQLRVRAAGMVGAETRWQVRVHVSAAPGPVELLLRAGFGDGGAVEVRRIVTVVPARRREDELPVAAATLAALGLVGLATAVVLLRRSGRAG
jgi:hypothetical protein